VAHCHCRIDGNHGTQSIFLNDKNDTVILMATCGALLCYQHWKPQDMEALNKLPKHFMMNVGPWEPQHFYDSSKTLDPPTSPITNGYGESSIQTIMQVPVLGLRPDPPSTWRMPPSETPIETLFTAPISQNTVVPVEEEPYYFDPSDNLNEWTWCRKLFTYQLTTPNSCVMHK